MHGLYAEFGHDKRPLEHLVIQAFLVGVGFSLLFPGLFFSTRSRGSDTSWPTYRLARFDLPSRTYTRRPGLRFLCRDESLGPFLFNSSLVSRPRPFSSATLLSKTHLAGLQDYWRRETLIRREPHRALLRALDAFYTRAFKPCFFSHPLRYTPSAMFFSLVMPFDYFWVWELFYLLGGVEAFLWLDSLLFGCERMREERRG